MDDTLEDKHLQINLTGDIDFPLVVDRQIQIDLTGDIDCPLLDYDLILRANDEGTQYIGFDIYDYKNQTHRAWIGFGEENGN